MKNNHFLKKALFKNNHLIFIWSIVALVVDHNTGKRYAIVGSSGSGKSTLLNLLLSGNSGYIGNIFYNEKELRDIAIAGLYDNISVVHQNVFIFDASIKDNITLFREFSDEEISQAVELSGLETLIKEKKLTYICGEHGCNISGGKGSTFRTKPNRPWNPLYRIYELQGKAGPKRRRNCL